MAGRRRLFGQRNDIYVFKTVDDAESFVRRLEMRSVGAQRRGTEVAVSLAGRDVAADEFWNAVDMKDRSVVRFGK